MQIIIMVPLPQKCTIINVIDKRNWEHSFSVGTSGKFISKGKSYVFQRRSSLNPNAQRTNCRTEQARCENRILFHFCYTFMLGMFFPIQILFVLG